MPCKLYLQIGLQIANCDIVRALAYTEPLLMSITQRAKELPDAALANHLMTHTDAGSILQKQCGDEVAQEFLSEVAQAVHQYDKPTEAFRVAVTEAARAPLLAEIERLKKPFIEDDSDAEDNFCLLADQIIDFATLRFAAGEDIADIKAAFKHLGMKDHTVTRVMMALVKNAPHHD